MIKWIITCLRAIVVFFPLSLETPFFHYVLHCFVTGQFVTAKMCGFEFGKGVCDKNIIDKMWLKINDDVESLWMDEQHNYFYCSDNLLVVTGHMQ